VLTAVVVDPMPIFRAGTVAALKAAGIAVVGEVPRLGQGVDLARRVRATAMLLGGATADEARQAVDALPACAVIVLLVQPNRDDLMGMLDAGVAGLALRSLTAEELVRTVEAAAEVGKQAAGLPVAPVFGPLPIGASSLPKAGNRVGSEPGLTAKELEILAQLAQGASNKRIAEALYVTPATVKTHLAHIYAKLGARGRHEAVSRALGTGILR
jgi:DNA-binding NarL/FixJ family response regulator